MRLVTSLLFLLFLLFFRFIINRFAQKLWPPTVRGLCGFANIGSIGVVLGGLGPIAKTRIPDLSKIAVRALVAGNIACFMPARITGEV